MLSRLGIPVVISAASGTGKTTVARELLSRCPNLTYSISCTTRPPRPGEVDGKDYFFVTEERFSELLRDGGLLEWAEVHGKRYGTPREFLERTMASGRDVLLDIDVQGAAQLRRSCPGGVQVFLLPPSWEVLRQRLTGRGTESAEVVSRRLDNARREMAMIGGYDYVVVNDDLARAVAAISAIIDAEHHRRGRLDEESFSAAFGFPPPAGA